MDSEIQAAIIAGLLIWMGWISLFSIQTNIKANKSLNNDATSQKEIESIIESMDTMTDELKSSFKELAKDVKDEMKSTNNRLDLFMKQEIDVLKNMAKR